MAKRRRSGKFAKRSHRRKRAFVMVRSNPGPTVITAVKRSKAKTRRRKSKQHHRKMKFTGLIPSKSSLFDAVYVTGGFIGTKIAANAVLPMIGINQPIVRVGVKAVLAGALGWAGSKVLGKSAGQFLMIGGLVEAVNDAVQTYVVPYVPALSVSSYPGLESYVDMSAYPDLSGMVSQDMDEQV